MENVLEPPRETSRALAVVASVLLVVVTGSIEAEAKQKNGTVHYDKQGKAYCEFSDGTFINPPFVGTPNPDGSVSCHARAVLRDPRSEDRPAVRPVPRQQN